MTPRLADILYIILLKVRSSKSVPESDIGTLRVRERERDLDRERCRPNTGDRPI